MEYICQNCGTVIHIYVKITECSRCKSKNLKEIIKNDNGKSGSN